MCFAFEQGNGQPRAAPLAAASSTACRMTSGWPQLKRTASAPSAIAALTASATLSPERSSAGPVRPFSSRSVAESHSGFPVAETALAAAWNSATELCVLASQTSTWGESPASNASRTSADAANAATGNAEANARRHCRLTFSDGLSFQVRIHRMGQSDPFATLRPGHPDRRLTCRCEDCTINNQTANSALERKRGSGAKMV